MPKPLIKNQYPGIVAAGVFAKARIDGNTGEFIFNEGFDAINKSGPGFYLLGTNFDSTAYPVHISLAPPTMVQSDYKWLINAVHYAGVQFIIRFWKWDSVLKNWDEADPYAFDVVLFDKYRS